MRPLVAAGVVAAVVAATTVVGYAVAGAGDGSRGALGPGIVTVHVDIEHSHFSIGDLDVHRGTLVRFVVRNHDPINHELVVGGPAVHARHERGHESAHPPVPGEVSVGPDDTGETVYRFDEPGGVFYACHLPGHEAYGMKGWITVT